MNQAGRLSHKPTGKMPIAVSGSFPLPRCEDIFGSWRENVLGKVQD